MVAKPYDGISGRVRRAITSDEACVAIAADMKRRLAIHAEDGSSGDEQATRIDSDAEGTSSSSWASGFSEECSRSPRSRTYIASEQIKLPVPCSYFAKGNCTRGHSCRFAHGDLELQGAISEAGNHRQRVLKTQLCSFFARGRCLSGARCFFAHGEAELRSSQEASPPPAPQSCKLEGAAKEPEMQEDFESMTSASVLRWDEELGQWVAETLEIEDLPSSSSDTCLSIEQCDSKKVEPKALDLEAALSYSSNNAGAVQTIKILLEARTPLRKNAASFVSWMQ